MSNARMSIARFPKPRAARRRVVALVLGLTLFALGLVVTDVHAQGPLPDVDIALVLDVRDAPGWLVLYAEVLGTPKQAPKPLGVSVEAGTGGSRSLFVSQPKFEVSVRRGAGSFNVIVHGKLSGQEALGMLPPFQLAVLELQGRGAGNQAVVSYGLSSVVASLLELYVVRP